MTGPRTLWRRLWMRFGVGIGKAVGRDDDARFEKAYRVEDPWDMSSPDEQERFSEINRLIEERLGAPATILEIGSGEGHHTSRLLALGAVVDGVEVSGRAVERAKKRCPAARFIHGSFPAAESRLKERYELVVASEVLYYIADAERALAAMNRLGRHCLVTFYAAEAARLSPFFERIPGVVARNLRRGGARWRLYLWESSKYAPAA